MDDALAHPYFDSIRSQYEAEVDPVLPVGPGALSHVIGVVLPSPGLRTPSTV